MRAVWLPANQAITVMFGTDMTPIGDHYLHADWATLDSRLAKCGLVRNKDNTITAAEAHHGNE